LETALTDEEHDRALCEDWWEWVFGPASGMRDREYAQAVRERYAARARTEKWRSAFLEEADDYANGYNGDMSRLNHMC